MSDLLLSFCRNCGKELPSYAFSFCPNCETPVTKDSRRFMVKDTLTSNFGKLIKLADNSDAASDILRNATSDPKFAAVAKRLVRNSPTIIETIVGFTPLAPFSKVIGDVLQNATKESTKSSTEEALEQFCIECGFKLKINSKFCRKCGTRQENK
jgi:predicted amidophosphoribosyltransferase